MSCKNANCGCSTNPLNTPCSYTNCSNGSERCDEVTCAECVSYCGDSFMVTGEGYSYVVNKGERLDQVLQKLYLILSGNCANEETHHAPFNLYTSSITNSTIVLNWNGVSESSDHFNVYYDTVTAPSGWTQANTNDISPELTSFTITELAPDTYYKIMIESVDDEDNSCNSVIILVSTLV